MVIIYELICTLILCYIVIYLWFEYKYTYWLRKGVSGPKPKFPYGNIEDVIKRRIQFFQPYCDYYKKYKHLPYVGSYSFHQPVLSINDKDIARLILIKDFEYFQAHGIFPGGVGDPLAGHLFNIHGERWKVMRSKMSSAFSPGKLKNMYPLVNKIADDALNYADALRVSDEAINFTQFYARYVMDVIGSVGFGVEFKCITNSNSEFFVRGTEYFVPKSLYWTLKRSLAFFAPNLFSKLRLRRISKEIVDFFYELVERTVTYREKHLYNRNDFLQTMIELKNETSAGEAGEKENSYGFRFTMNDVACNAVLYLFAGYETSATTGQFVAYELAMNTDVQAKAREEIDRILAKYGGECTYEAQNEMVYMNMIIDETMRIYPPMRALFRRCTKSYKVPNTDLVIDEGTLVFIPIQAIQMDPKIFPQPHKFDPERFSSQKKAKMNSCHWMPFGEGPRKCLGLRQGYIQTKIALVKLLHKYEFILDWKTSVPLKVKASSMACAAEGDVWIRLKKIERNKQGNK